MGGWREGGGGVTCGVWVCVCVGKWEGVGGGRGQRGEMCRVGELGCRMGVGVSEKGNLDARQ